MVQPVVIENPFANFVDNFTRSYFASRELAQRAEEAEAVEQHRQFLRDFQTLDMLVKSRPAGTPLGAIPGSLDIMSRMVPDVPRDELEVMALIPETFDSMVEESMQTILKSASPEERKSLAFLLKTGVSQEEAEIKRRGLAAIKDNPEAILNYGYTLLGVSPPVTATLPNGKSLTLSKDEWDITLKLADIMNDRMGAGTGLRAEVQEKMFLDMMDVLQDNDEGLGLSPIDSAQAVLSWAAGPEEFAQFIENHPHGPAIDATMFGSASAYTATEAAEAVRLGILTEYSALTERIKAAGTDDVAQDARDEIERLFRNAYEARQEEVPEAYRERGWGSALRNFLNRFTENSTLKRSSVARPASYQNQTLRTAAAGMRLSQLREAGVPQQAIVEGLARSVHQGLARFDELVRDYDLDTDTTRALAGRVRELSGKADARSQ